MQQCKALSALKFSSSHLSKSRLHIQYQAGYYGEGSHEGNDNGRGRERLTKNISLILLLALQTGMLIQ